jgi:uracil phosphoribosyltransferase
VPAVTGGVVLVDHPLVAHKLALLRAQTTDTQRFRDLTAEIASFLCYEATRELELEEVSVRTPLEDTRAWMIKGKKAAVIPVLRAGLGMVEGVTNLLPAARVGFAGVYRDHDSLEPVQYYAKFPAQLDERLVLVLDPMLATGGSASHVLTLLKERGARTTKLLSVVAAPEGVAHVRRHHPDVTIVVAAVDRELNEHGYILPGLGDAGDRLFGTR